jgi:hypothetical protein
MLKEAVSLQDRCSSACGLRAATFSLAAQLASRASASRSVCRVRGGMTSHQVLRTGAGGEHGRGVAAATAERDDEPEAAQA